MAECNHEFIGKSDGIHCTKCGLHLSATEYAKSLQSKTVEHSEKTKRQTRKKVKTDE